METTDAQGKVIFDVPPGDYVLDVVPGTFFRDAPDQEVLALKDGETRPISFQLDRTFGRITATVTRTDTGLPVAGIEVAIRAR